jgi:hypothetical protein
MEQNNRNKILTAHKPTAMDVAIYRALNPDWNRGIEPAYQPSYTPRKFNPTKYSSRALLTIEQLMKNDTQSDVALKIMKCMPSLEIGKIHDINEDQSIDPFVVIDKNTLFTGKKAYVKQLVFDASNIKPVERNNIKGAYMGVCNMSSCKSGQPASWYNYGSHAYYCPGCARRLSNDPVNRRDAFNSFGHDLCLEGPEITKD